VIAVPALQMVSSGRPSWDGVRPTLDRLAEGQDPYVVRMWREALLEAEGLPRAATSDPLAFPYVPFLPEDFGLPLSAASRVLDLGCLGGFGLFDFTVRRARQGLAIPRLHGIDVDRSSLQLGAALAPSWAGRGQVNFQLGSGEMLPYASGVFDMVIARSVLQYLHIRPAIFELARLARTGGLVLIQIHALGYYFHRMWRHFSSPLQSAYYARALASGMIFSATSLQPKHRWFREAGMTPGRLLALCKAVGLELVWSNPVARRPLALFVRV
jgi:SAM-dependent methyltransferase